MSTSNHSGQGQRQAGLVLTALGVVFGDIGTSPLYALRECFTGAHGLPPTPANIFGVLSLVFWSLIIVISIKYLLYVMRADNRGEGGVLALMALARLAVAGSAKREWLVVALGLFGAALLYGDGIITPAISVLGAMEGISVVAPAFAAWITPLTLLVLLALFAVQSRGTHSMGVAFGPVILLWFLVLGALGLAAILQQPQILQAVNPQFAAAFFAANGFAGFAILGAVTLVVTGGEALYADMGHFGRRPIQIAWFAVVLPGLLLNYFGQGALLIANPEASTNPFYLLAPEWLRLPLIGLSTAATVIASQAVISGAFSISQQAVQLGYCPRLQVLHTSASERGQIYVPLINWLLMLGTIILVLEFGTSSNLAAAYGIAVTATMVLTTLLAYILARRIWRWPAGLVVAVTLLCLLPDVAFFSANLLKLGHGGWMPLALAGAIFLLFATWRRGRELLSERLRRDQVPLAIFMPELEANKIMRVPGTAVYMTGQDDGIPRTVLHQLKFNHVLHRQVVLLTIASREVPFVLDAERLQFESCGQGLYRVIGSYGFMERADVPKLLERCRPLGLQTEPMQTTYFLGRETLIPSAKPGMALWREKIFAFMSQNAYRATSYFNIPANRVVELGIQVEI